MKLASHFALSGWTHSKACLQKVSGKTYRRSDLPVFNIIKHNLARKLGPTLKKTKAMKEITYLTHF